MELFKLVGKIFVDSNEAQNSISKTGEKADGLGSKLASSAATAAKWAAGVAGAASAVGGAMVAAAKSTAANLDTIDKMSQRLGITRDAYQELDYVLSQSGVDVNSFQTGMKSLLANMDRVTEGNKTATANFEKLGISVQNADGSLKTQQQVLYEAIPAFQAMADGAEKSRLAQELFGKQGQEILPLLNAQSGSFEELTQAAHDLGIVMSDEAIDAGVDFTDMMDNVMRQVSSVKNNLVSELMPYAVEILNWVSDNLPVIQSTIKSVADSIVPIVEPVLSAVMDMLPPMLERIKAFLDWITPYIAPIMQGIVSVVSGVMALISGDFDGFVGGIKTALENFIPVIMSLGADLFNALWDGIKSVWESISGWVSEKVGWLTDKLAFWRSGSNEMSSNSSTYSAYSGGTSGRGGSFNSSSASGSQQINLSIDLDGATLARKTYDYNRAEASRRGTSLVNA